MIWLQKIIRTDNNILRFLEYNEKYKWLVIILNDIISPFIITTKYNFVSILKDGALTQGIIL